MSASGLHARSLLFVPGDRPERFDKAIATRADSIIIDLEDAVSPDHKSSALQHALEWLAAGHPAIVRVNAAGTPWHDTDVAALAPTGATILLPKAQAIEDVAAVRDQVGDRIIALVETARGVRDADALASAPGVVRLALGNVDLSTELGVDPASRSALAYARGRLVIASAASELVAPIDGVTVSLDSAGALAADLAVTRELGFGGKLCIHPRQVRFVNDALSPTKEEVEWARNILAFASSDGVSVVDGLMVDPPVIKRAEQILART